MGLLLAFAGDLLAPQLPTVLPLFLDRLKNEVTRAAVLKVSVGFAGLFLLYLQREETGCCGAISSTCAPLFPPHEACVVHPPLPGSIAHDSFHPQALGFVAESYLLLDLSPILGPAVEELGTFLRQQSRSLKQATLSTLVGFVRFHGDRIAFEALRDVRLFRVLFCAESDAPVLSFSLLRCCVRHRL